MDLSQRHWNLGEIREMQQYYHGELSIGNDTCQSSCCWLINSETVMCVILLIDSYPLMN
jgi:hypothetical protein